MAIQGTQVPMYTKHTLFLYFSNFSKNKYIYIKKKKKTKLKTNKNMLNKEKHKNQTDSKKNKAKHISNANKNKKGERETVIESLGALFLPHLESTFPSSKPLIRR